jgi:hypothetical protein
MATDTDPLRARLRALTEQVVAAEPPPVEEPPARPDAVTAATGLAAALAAGGAVAPVVVGVQAYKQGADTVMAGTAMVLAALAHQAGQMDVAEIVAAAMDDPVFADDDIEQAIQAERAMQETFVRKQRARVKRDLPKALKLEDAAERRAAVQKLVEREKRYSQQRIEALRERLAGMAEMKRVEAQSPGGALWLLSDGVKVHTPDCIAMSGKVWPWPVLKLWHPPLHHGCPCILVGIPDALKQGLIKPGMIPTDHADAVKRARAIMRKAQRLEEVAAEGEVEAYLEAVEARWERRFPKGTDRAGQFMPRRGGSARALLRDLVPRQPRRRVTRIGGHRVVIPEERSFKRTIGDHTYTSPPGTTKVLRDGKPLGRDPGGEKHDLTLTRPTGDLRPSTPEREALAKVLNGAQADTLTGMRYAGVEEGLLAHGFIPVAVKGEDPLNRYFYRHPSGSTMTLNLVRWASGRMEVGVAYYSPAQVPVRADYPRASRPPETWDEFLKDATALAANIAERTNAHLGLGTIATSEHLTDHTGDHSWDGDIRLAPNVMADVQDALNKQARGETITLPSPVYRAYHTTAHELLHAINAGTAGDYHTQGGRTLEEALVEELSHVVAQELLSDHGLGEVAQWAANNPSKDAARGTYIGFRATLDGMLNDAGVPAADRPGLLWAMKTGMQTDDRLEFLAALMKTDVEAVRGRLTSNATGKDMAEYLPMVAASTRPVVTPGVFRMGGEQVGRGALLRLKDGTITRVADVGDQNGVVFAWTDDEEGHVHLVTEGDVDRVLTPPTSRGDQGRSLALRWEGAAEHEDVAIGDVIDFGDGTHGRVEDVFGRGSATAIRVATDQGSVWVTEKRRTVHPIKVTTGRGPEMEEPPEAKATGTQSIIDAGFGKAEQAGEELMLLQSVPHLLRMSLHRVLVRQRELQRIVGRDPMAANADVVEAEAELRRIERLIKAREAARDARAKAFKREHGYWAITQAEYDAAMDEPNVTTDDPHVALPGGVVAPKSVIFDHVHRPDGKIRIVKALRDARDAPMYRSDLLSQEHREAALRSIGAYDPD